MKGIIMKKSFSIAAAIATIGEATTNKAGARSWRFPTFELASFPSSSHQMANVVERSPAPSLKLAGMPSLTDRGPDTTQENRDSDSGLSRPKHHRGGPRIDLAERGGCRPAGCTCS